MTQEVLQSHLQRLLSAREPPKTICPSEAARAVSAQELEDAGAASWRDLMPAARACLGALRDAGAVEILQKGTVLPADRRLEDVRGPIRARRIAAADSPPEDA